ncbi:hypothetical protein OHA21_00935 [Actinoplanes sp. NBC_00393]|uniref:hypothetical protein n=1 Tax=Actinoplanes sp. NBC_00393 TaxID=2975953 RepID=UPI002E1B861C
MTDWFIDGTIGWLATAVLAVIAVLWKLLSHTAFITPDVTTLPAVAAIIGRATMIVNVSFVLAIIAAGVTVMMRETVQSHYGLGELAPRLIIGWIGSNFAVPICTQLVEVANAVTAALTGEGVVTSGALLRLHVVIVEALTSPPSMILAVVIGLLIVALTLMLILAWLVRLCVLILLVGVSPLALACHATPFTEAAARLWWRAMLAVLAIVLLQALALHTALAVFLTPDADLAALGVARDDSGTLDLLVVVCLLWITVKIPALLRRYVTGGSGGRNPAAMFLRMVVAQQLTGRLRKSFARPRGRRGFTSTAAAGPPTPGAGGTRPALAGLSGTAGQRRLPRPRGAGQGRVGVAWPTGRAVKPYTPQEIAGGVDVYTRTVPKRPTPTLPRSSRPPIRAAGVQPDRTPAGPRPPLPTGVNPATAMPKRRPVRPPTTGPWQQPRRRS